MQTKKWQLPGSLHPLRLFIYGLLIVFALIAIRPKKAQTYSHYQLADQLEIQGQLFLPQKDGTGRISGKETGQAPFYEGKWKAGRFEGPGKITFPDGSYVEGVFQGGALKEGRFFLKDQGWFVRKGAGQWVKEAQ